MKQIPMTAKDAADFITKLQSCETMEEVNALVDSVPQFADVIHGSNESVANGKSNFDRELKIASDIANSAVEFVHSRAHMAECNCELGFLVAGKLMHDNAQRILDGEGDMPKEMAQMIYDMLDQAVREGDVTKIEPVTIS